MRKSLFILILLSSIAILGCKRGSKNTTIKPPKGIIKKDSIKVVVHDSIYNNIFSKDTLKIAWGVDVAGVDHAEDTLTHSDLKRFDEDYPELFAKTPRDPDIDYALIKNKETNDSRYTFGSEAGQDGYYLFYSYFLKIRNGEKKHSGMRDTLRKIFRTINGINDGLVSGGTYFGHMHKRIEGYIEYAVYCNAGVQNNYDREQNGYNINVQKAYFIKCLRQLIADELDNSHEYFGKDKRDVKTKMFVMLDKIDKLITSKFYLKEAQKFQYVHY